MHPRALYRPAAARRLGTSQAYVTKVLRGDVNFTLVTLVKLARAVGGRVRLDLCDAVIPGHRTADPPAAGLRRKHRASAAGR